MGKPGHFCCLLVFCCFGFFPNPGGNDLVYCYYLLPVSIRLHSTCASSHSHSLHSPICSQCHCICPCRHYLILIFCWVLNHYRAANLQITAYKMSFTRNTSQYRVNPANLESTFVLTVCGPTSSFLLFSSKTSHSKREVLSNLDCLIFRLISLFLAMSCY